MKQATALRAIVTALLKSTCPNLTLWTFSLIIRMISSCHHGHAAQTPKPCWLLHMHPLFLSSFSRRVLIHIIFFMDRELFFFVLFCFVFLSMAWMSPFWTNFKSLLETWKKQNRSPERKYYYHLKMIFPQPGSQRRLGWFGWSFPINCVPLAKEIPKYNVVKSHRQLKIGLCKGKEWETLVNS